MISGNEEAACLNNLRQAASFWLDRRFYCVLW
jgi:hypothetical protein